ncbi:MULTISPECIES: DUF6792 domain-containing protein [Clostridia]|uniref:DUF6792 domain-containing protein n=1 Tax=Clostridia TaxID=186801 RepID=UPI000EA367E9|nr:MULTISPECIES: DUF6792 domain-containing protein [Clostridia]NBJ71423.1 hypothetical protein [Roseburia sp. 1XD42-34]RKI74640.1 hypothetical protein D7V87_18365 [Clostridium sp. 1xD42-85]
MSKKLATSKEFKLRLIDLQYRNLPEEEMSQQIKQVYLEEHGKELDAKIDVYNSYQSSNELFDSSGYDGTAIHFSSKESGVNEVYVISQGSKDALDWEYNIKAMFAGKDSSQALAVNNFVYEARKEFGVANTIPTTGLSHSLAHNNNTTAHFVFDTFDEVYSVNGAQTNYYQLYFIDIEFENAVKRHFSLSLSEDHSAIYDIDPNQLRQFAENHYKDKAKNIHQIISKDDPLYAASAVRGFFTLGNVEMVDTNPDYPGLRSLIEDIPDEVIKDFQELAIQYTTASNQGGVNAAIEEILGVNMDVVNKISDNSLKTYLTNQNEINRMVRQLDKKVPSLLKQVKTITSNSELIFGRLVDTGYITNAQKQLIVKEFSNIETELEGIKETLSTIVRIRDTGSFSAQIGGDIAAVLKVKGHINAIKDSLKALNEADLLKVLEELKASHGIKEVLSSLSHGKKSYLGTDMLFTTNHGNKEIKVNISAALRMYQEGKKVLEEKLSKIRQFQVAIDREISQCYDRKKYQVMRKIDDIEANPSAYTRFLRNHISFSRLDKKVRRIQVHEVFFPLEYTNLDEEIYELKQSVQKSYTYIENYRQAIEDLFTEEKEVATLFRLVEGE